MKRTWVIPAVMVAGLVGLGGAAYAASAQDDWRDGLGTMVDEGAADYNWSGQRWRDRDDDRRDYGPREGRRGNDDCGPGMGRGGEHGWRHHGRGPGMHHGYGPREGRGYGWREGRGDDRRDDSGRGYGRGPGHGRHGGFGHGGPGGFGGMFDPAAADGIKRELSITTQQEAAWTKYASALKDAADAMKARRESMRAGAARGLSAEDHRKFRDSMMEQRRKEIDAVRNAADELVKSLDEKQVAIAKEVLPGYAFGPGMRMGMGMDGGR